MKPKAKPRKPRDLEVITGPITYFSVDGWDPKMSLKNIRRLHKWLTQAIAYLEAKESK